MLEKLTEICRRDDSQPVGRVITEINPMLRGWVHSFRIGHSGRCFASVTNWVEKEGATLRAVGEASAGLRREEVEYGGAGRGAGVVP